ncbi:hypothetical protein QBC39DRAFT_253744 [Podospora conica]|nr:hypothetical protein QBC39DRAFT_253744 [Schizothecium conicum]
MSLKPTLSLSTPVTANFPHHTLSASELSDLRSAVSLPSAVSERTPLSAISRTSAFRDPLAHGLPSAGLPSAGPYSATLRFEDQKTPITPPVAYLDFLKSMSLISPCMPPTPQTGRALLNRTSTASSTESRVSVTSNASSASDKSSESDESDKEKSEQIDSGPSTGRTDVSCECMRQRSRSPRPAPINTSRPPTPRGALHPLSAPATADVFPSMKLPASPAVSTAGLYSPRSPLSATSVQSHFDWDAALKSRRYAETPGSGCKRPAQSETPPTPKAAPGTPTHNKRESRSSIRHIREVVTRTVTYTPRMAPAPKGKRRKLDTDDSPAEL